MPKKPRLTPEQRYANKRACEENYRHRVRRFTFQFSLKDDEAREWFELQPDKGKYLKTLILADKEKQVQLNGLPVIMAEDPTPQSNETSVEINTKLCEKVQAEYDGFIARLSEMSAEEVLEHAYEKVIKEDLLILFQYGDIEPKQAKAFCKMKYPLDYCYHEWRNNDYSYMDLLQDTIGDASRKAIQHIKSRESR